MRSHDVSVTDITNGGAGLQTNGLAVLPLTFELYLDDLRRKCRLVWRKGNFFGVAFENQATSTDNESDTSTEADIVIPGPALLVLNDPPTHAYFDDADGWSEHLASVSDQKTPRRAGLPFTAGVAIALALPVFIGVSVYAATIAFLG